MISVRKLLGDKGTEVWGVSPEDTVFKTLEMMEEKGVGALAVKLDGKLVGIISERDYARKIVLKGKSSKDTKVKDIMTRQVFHTFPDQIVEECLVLMNDKRIRHLPVLEDDNLIGMISIGDVVKQIIADQQYTIKHLENYISWEESY